MSLYALVGGLSRLLPAFLLMLYMVVETSRLLTFPRVVLYGSTP